jgi:hypothetical protein
METQVRMKMTRLSGVRRFPIEAQKDPRAIIPPAASRGDDWFAVESAFDRQDADDLAAILFTLCPHEWLDVVHYRTVASQLAVDLSTRVDKLNLFLHDIRAVRERFGKPFNLLESTERVEAVSSWEQTEYFRYVLNFTIRRLYDNPVVWTECGYEGTAGCSADKKRENFDDIDWLPEFNLGVVE